LMSEASRTACFFRLVTRGRTFHSVLDARGEVASSCVRTKGAVRTRLRRCCSAGRRRHGRSGGDASSSARLSLGTLPVVDRNKRLTSKFLERLVDGPRVRLQIVIRCIGDPEKLRTCHSPDRGSGLFQVLMVCRSEQPFEVRPCCACEHV